MKKTPRVLIKISWESLAWDQSFWIDHLFLKKLAYDIYEIHKEGIELALVLGGGNLVRGMQFSQKGIDRSTADYMGMLATVINGLAFQETLEMLGCETRLMSALDIPEVWEKYIKRRALRHLEKKRIILCVAWTGNPFFTTDTAGVLRARELDCDFMIKATKVDGVYDKDPHTSSDATFFHKLSFDEVLQKNIHVMDHTAITLAKEWNLAIKIVSLYTPHSLLKACLGEPIGTTIQ